MTFIVRACKTGRGWERTVGRPVRRCNLDSEAAPVRLWENPSLCVPSRNSVGCSEALRPAAPPGLSSTWFGSPPRLQPLCCSNLPERSTSADAEGLTLGSKSAEVDMPAIWAPGFTMPILPHSSGHCKAGSQERTVSPIRTEPCLQTAFHSSLSCAEDGRFCDHWLSIF